MDLDIKERCRINMYLWWCISEDVETQRKGVVIIGWPDDNDDPEDDQEISNNNNDSNRSNNSMRDRA